MAKRVGGEMRHTIETTDFEMLDAFWRGGQLSLIHKDRDDSFIITDYIGSSWLSTLSKLLNASVEFGYWGNPLMRAGARAHNKANVHGVINNLKIRPAGDVSKKPISDGLNVAGMKLNGADN